MSKFHDSRTFASDPGGVRLSDLKLRRLCPEWYGLGTLTGGWLRRAILREHLLLGDSRAALVMQVQPLLIAAYTDEMDCVALLRFPDRFAAEYELRPKSPLLTVNTYRRGTRMARDLTAGPLAFNRYVNFQPVIAEFVSDDLERIGWRKQSIAPEEWERAWAMGSAYMARSGPPARDGSPARSMLPG